MKALRYIVGMGLLILMISCLNTNQKSSQPDIYTEPVSDSVRAQQIADLKYGMFICWSTSSFSGKEWTKDGHGPDFFKATGCNTDQWCRVAKESEIYFITGKTS